MFCQSIDMFIQQLFIGMYQSYSFNFVHQLQSYNSSRLSIVNLILLKNAITLEKKSYVSISKLLYRYLRHFYCSIMHSVNDVFLIFSNHLLIRNDNIHLKSNSKYEIMLNKICIMLTYI